MKKKLKILITAVGSSNGRAVSIILKSRFPNIQQLGSDVNPPESITPLENMSQIFQVPYAVDKKYNATIIQLCTENNVDYIIPVHDDEVVQLNFIKEDLAKIGTNLFSSKNDVLENCRDKYLFSQLCLKHSIKTIESSLKPNFSFPMFIKPRQGNGSFNCFKIENDLELETYSRKVKSHVFQKFETGKIYAVDFVSDQESKLICLLSREEVQTKGGVGVKVIIQDDANVLEIVSDLVSKIGYVGIGGIEFFINDGVYTIIELNARPSSGLHFTYLAGLDILAHFLKAAGEDWIIPKDSKIQYGKRMHRELVTFEI